MKISIEAPNFHIHYEGDDVPALKARTFTTFLNSSDGKSFFRLIYREMERANVFDGLGEMAVVEGAGEDRNGEAQKDEKKGDGRGRPGSGA